MTAELIGLQDDLADVFAEFTPAEVWVDPEPLLARANRCADLLRARDKLRGRFRRYRRLGPALIPTIAGYILGLISATLYFTEVVHESWTKWLGFALGGLAVAVALVIFALYAFCESKLTAAEEMAAGDRP